MFNFTLPKTTQIIGGKLPLGKSFTAVSLAFNIMINNSEYNLLYITDKYEERFKEFDELGLNTNVIIDINHNKFIDSFNYNALIIDIDCKLIDSSKMLFETPKKLSTDIISYIEHISAFEERHFISITASLY